MRKGEMQMKVKNLFIKERKKNVQMNLLNLEQRDWQPNLSIKDKKTHTCQLSRFSREYPSFSWNLPGTTYRGSFYISYSLIS